MSDCEIQKLRADTELLRARTDHKLALQLAQLVEEGEKLANRNIYVVCACASFYGAAVVAVGMLFAKYVLLS